MTISKEHIPQQFGKNLCDLRISKGFSQEEFAFKVGLHRTYIGGIERGERNVSLINIVLIASALQVSISELFDGIQTQ